MTLNPVRDPMNARDVLKKLESLGTAQNRKVYARHGALEPMFGVSYANLEKLRKQIGVDQKIAEALWDSGNHDARVLATKIADPAKITGALLDRWFKDVEDYVVGGAFAAIAAQTKVARAKMQKWTKARDEWTGTAGWNLVAHLASTPGALSDAECEVLLETIENEIHDRENRVRYAMNQAVICIGVRNATLQKKAIAAAKHIGKVHVDHGETGCKTPDAAAYIEKTVEYRKKQAARKKAPAAKKQPAGKKKASKARTARA